ncbi:ornithine decarboxylase SpeF [Vibrio aestuarianus]|uniref:ornithine decarboxylase n=1 Tax=Vibrio aestuarianus TaxID=28171 RepID=A0ABD7YI67_9VIBR|nr:ornithine decarboxylase SpeF [Vibrio aestuarianus]MDE1334403.1 ornithine decarboxylase SpeF [Vibrio aestuarianus]WGK84504.1 ornithine decarboxylase SpeF [Vibrio aestuarianus]CAH8202173.1 ornithine decarboxylase isozyme, inducible [Vibrio aestuarianus]
MNKLKIAISENINSDNHPVRVELENKFQRRFVILNMMSLTDIGAVVINKVDLAAGVHKQIDAKGYKLPVFLTASSDVEIGSEDYSLLTGVINIDEQTTEYYSRQINAAVEQYESNLLPPFFKKMTEYVNKGYAEFDCPGHQGGQFFKKHPTGKQFYDFFGENLFRSDLCNADVDFGDLLIHEGAAQEAQSHAARVYNADKTYFVLNGTSASNRVVSNALVTQDDLVLFDRNNHKSNHQAALMQAGGIPVYLETARNPYGFIGGIDEHCFEEAYIREQIAKVDPKRAQQERPFRLAIIQLGTYDGTIYNARYVMDKIGHLCDYILFDSAWVGYEQFIPMMKDCSPLLLDLTENDAGVIVTQSVHKQQAGFSQTSQIHKKDSHIKGQKRYCNHKRFNNAFMMHASTSPFYALFASLDINAKMHEGQAGRELWRGAVETGIEARKEILKSCKGIKPFIPDMIDGRPWASYETSEIANDKKFFMFAPKATWHKFEGYGEEQYFIDPCKLLLTTPGIAEDGSYADFGIPATLLANFLRENGIIPEKCDLNSILFLLTPSEDNGKTRHLVAQLNRFERYVKEDAPLHEVLPNVYSANEERYRGYTIRQLCQEMHDMYKAQNVKQLQKEMFRCEHFPERVHNPDVANRLYFRGECDYVALKDAVGRVAAEGALPYPPGIICVVNGEMWTQRVVDYFLSLEEGINRFPGFAPEIQGVYLEDIDGHTTAHCYVLKD